MANTSDIKNGVCLEINGDLLVITQFQHVKPGKGPAFVRTKMKSLKTGKVIDRTFTAGIKLDIARIERRSYQYLYKDQLGHIFMHNETYEQIPIPEDVIAAVDLLKEGQNVEITFHADTETPLSCELPAFVEMDITYTEPGMRGDTSSTSSLKAATVETGATIQVPLFVNTGDRIKIDTRDHSYSERVKK